MPARRSSKPSFPFASPASSFPMLEALPLAPWLPVFSTAALVVPMRLALMPWLMMTDPEAGSREAHLMVEEKRAAFNESLTSLWFAPMRYWTGVMTFAIAPGQAGIERALAEASRLAAKPYLTRVRSNQRRLARGG